MGLEQAMAGEEPPRGEWEKPFLGCHRRRYNYRVTQTDKNGRQCWDFVNVKSCWGRCDSNEITDWKFPYKRSFHPVCVHADRAPAVTILKNCDPDVEPETAKYQYMDAISCRCQACSSSDTSCEAPKETHGISAVKILDITGAGVSEPDMDY